MKNNLEAKVESIFEVLYGDFSFEIPSYQRDYAWTFNENVNQLLEDIFYASDEFTNTNNIYPIGTIILLDEKDGYSVVDGQQRLTTITIILRVLYDIAKEYEQINETVKYNLEDRLTDLKKCFRISKNYKEHFHKIKKHKKDKDYYNYLIVEREWNLPIDSRKISGKKSKLKKTYEHTKNALIKLLLENNLDQSENSLSKISEKKLLNAIDFILHKVKLIKAVSDNDINVFQLFEVLNNRGLALTQFDLLNNFLISILEKNGAKKSEKEQYNNYVKEIDSTNIDTILVNYSLAFLGEKSKKADIFKTFKKHIEEENYSIDDVLQLIENIKKYNDFYKKLKKYDVTAFDLFDSNSVKNSLKVICQSFLHINQILPYIFLLLESNADTNSQQLFIKNLGKYVFSLFASDTQFNVLEHFNKSIFKDILNSDGKATLINRNVDSDILKKFSEKLYAASLNYLPIIHARFNADLGFENSKACLILLYIENMYRSILDDSKYPILFENVKNITVEHIIPQSIVNNQDKNRAKEYNFDDLEKAEVEINKIGNLCLMNPDFNSSASNKPFPEKKEFYENSNFLITKTLVTSIDQPIQKKKKNFDTFNTLAYAGKFASASFNEQSIELRIDIYLTLIDNIIEHI